MHAPGETDNPEVFLSERRSDEGRFLFVVNNTTPNLEPGQLWRVSLCVATRVPVVAPVRLGSSGGAVYDVFAGKRVDAKGEMVEADLRSLPARIFAVLPEAIRSVDLHGPSDGVAAGQEFAWSVKVLSDQRKEIRSSVPVRVQLRDSRGRILSERFAATTAGGLAGTFVAPLNAPENELDAGSDRIVQRTRSATAATRDGAGSAHHTDGRHDRADASRAGSGPLNRQAGQESLGAGRTGFRTACSRHYGDCGWFPCRAQHDELGPQPPWNRPR